MNFFYGDGYGIMKPSPPRPVAIPRNHTPEEKYIILYENEKEKGKKGTHPWEEIVGNSPSVNQKFHIE